MVRDASKGPFPDYPFRGNFLEINGARMHYLDEGDRDAPPLLMLHGNPTWSFFFRRAVSALSPRCRCIVPDHIGMGLSETPGEDRYRYRLSSRVDDIEALLEHLGVRENITLLLHDWGGMIGMAWAARRPGAVRRIALLNTAAFPLPPGAGLPWQLAFSRSALGPLAIRGLNAFCLYAVRHCVARRPLGPEVAAAYLAPYGSWRTRLAVLRFVQDIPLSPGDESYALVSGVASSLHRFAGLPAIIFWGMRDFVFGPPFLDEWISHLPSAEVHRYEDAGHLVLEDRGETILPLLGKFLDANPLPGEGASGR